MNAMSHNVLYYKASPNVISTYYQTRMNSTINIFCTTYFWVWHANCVPPLGSQEGGVLCAVYLRCKAQQKFSCEQNAEQTKIPVMSSHANCHSFKWEHFLALVMRIIKIGVNAGLRQSILSENGIKYLSLEMLWKYLCTLNFRCTFSWASELLQQPL